MMLEDGLNNFLIISKVRNRIFGFQFENDILCRIYDFQSESPVGNISGICKRCCEKYQCRVCGI